MIKYVKHLGSVNAHTHDYTEYEFEYIYIYNFFLSPYRTSLKRSHCWPGVGLEPGFGANAPPVAIKRVVYESRTHGLKCLLGQTWLRNLGHCCMGTRGNASKLQNRGFREREAIYLYINIYIYIHTYLHTYIHTYIHTICILLSSFFTEQATVGVRKLQHFLCKDPTAYGATGQNWIPFLSAVHWLNALCHSKHCCTVVYRPCF